LASRKPAATTVGALARRGERWFRDAGLSYGHGTTNARDEAIYLTLHALKLPLDRLPATRAVSAAQAAPVLELFRRRIRQRVPAAYLTNEAWLGEHCFYTDERVIVPRSYIAELLLHDPTPCWPPKNRVRRALDLCTGSACLAILMGKRFRSARIDAADISGDALDVARINVRRHRLTRRIALVKSSYFQALGKRRYDLIITNPPYVRTSVMRKLPREYRREPVLALAGGDDGLEAVRVILAQAAKHLNPGGVLVVECGHARERVERSWPRLPFLWPETSGGDDCVFVLTREELLRPGALGGRESQSVRRRTSSGSSSLN
jgi:ribosomal protein L3 glutamine methyltransferase